MAKNLDGNTLSDLAVGVPTSEATPVVKSYLDTSLTRQSYPSIATELDPGVSGVFVG